MNALDSLPVFCCIRTRRIHAAFTDQPVSQDLIVHLLAATRWAPSASNRRLQKFVVIRHEPTIRLLRTVAPGMRGQPPVLILICNDTIQARRMGVKMDRDTTNWIDIGAAAQNIMLAAHELGLATGPATSFSRSGVCAILDLPPHLIPEYFLQLGYPAPEAPRSRPRGASTRIPVDNLTLWYEPVWELSPDKSVSQAADDLTKPAVE